MCFPERGDHHLQMVFMLPYSTGVYEYIVQIYMDESSNLFLEDGGHELLECRGGVAATSCLMLS
jgi:hypothetical protein